MLKPIVYQTKEVTPKALLNIFEALDHPLTGNTAVKVHSGEIGNQNFIRPAFMKLLIDQVEGTIVECNTAYEGKRSTSKEHRKTLAQHGWTDNFKVDILDEDGEMVLDIPSGKCITQNFVGSHMKNYESMLVISHFKGHPMGGLGGALKNISIGLASAHGKAHIHGAGVPENIWTADHDSFLESMSDAAKSVADYYGDKIVYINILANMSVDCDCCEVAEDPKMADLGIMASLDPVALDQACVDAVYASTDPGKSHLIKRIESRNGLHTIEAACALGVGSREYELKKI